MPNTISQGLENCKRDKTEFPQVLQILGEVIIYWLGIGNRFIHVGFLKFTREVKRLEDGTIANL